jgi:hypothetical protein
MSNLEILRQQILDQLPTDQQREAIFAEELEFLLRATPGSGKTWTSSRRFIWRGANWPYSCGGLALLSFTNAAIREFQAATIEVERRDLLSDPNYVGTFDAFVERFILTPFGHLPFKATKRPKLLVAPRPGDRNNGNLKAWYQSDKGLRPVPAWEIIPCFLQKKKIGFKASEDFGGHPLQFTNKNPVDELMKLGFYTHDQRVYWASRILKNGPHIANVIARRFPEVIVDEAQDTNVWLLYLLDILREQGVKVTLVGDPDQCIYEFSMANAKWLPALKQKWSIPEKPLSKSFRCNNAIAKAVRNIGGNEDFSGSGDNLSEHCRPFIIKEPGKTFSRSVTEFEQILNRAGIAKSSSAIICRGHQQVEDIRGQVIYTHLQGETKKLAQASFVRDCRKDYKKAFKLVTTSIRVLVEDQDLWDRVDAAPESEEGQKVQLAIWRFVKSDSGLPSVSLTGTQWISQLRKSLAKIVVELGAEAIPNLNLKIKKTGLDEKQMRLPLFEAETLFPAIRQETIHQVKGESIDGVLVIGSSKFWNSVVDAILKGTISADSEDRRLAYVAMTRARHLLLVALPASHYDKHVDKWKSWGFITL